MKVPVPSQECKRPCICVTLALSAILILYFEIVPKVCVCGGGGGVELLGFSLHFIE